MFLLNKFQVTQKSARINECQLSAFQPNIVAVRITYKIISIPFICAFFKGENSFSRMLIASKSAIISRLSSSFFKSVKNVVLCCCMKFIKIFVTLVYVYSQYSQQSPYRFYYVEFKLQKMIVKNWNMLCILFHCSHSC